MNCTFVKENLEEIRGKHFAVFACQSGAGADKAMAKLTKAIGKDSFEAQAVFIDPKKKHADSTDAAIAEFCRKLQEVQ